MTSNDIHQDDYPDVVLRFRYPSGASTRIARATSSAGSPLYLVQHLHGGERWIIAHSARSIAELERLLPAKVNLIRAALSERAAA